MADAITIQGLLQVTTGIYTALGLLTVIASVGITYGVIKTTQKETERRLNSLEASRSTLWEKVNTSNTAIASLGATLEMIHSDVKALRAE